VGDVVVHWGWGLGAQSSDVVAQSEGFGNYLEKGFIRIYLLPYWKETASQKLIVIFVFRPQLLILCNKQDLGTAKGATLIQVSLLDYSQNIC
jgi:hypothetical protein